MLSAQELELLTAHVDGELTPVQKCELLTLLERSDEARELLQQLEQDSLRFRAMPPLPIPRDISHLVVDQIIRTGRPPVRTLTPATPPRRLTFWVGLVTAAAILLAVGFGSFWLHSDPVPSEQDGRNLAAIPIDRADEGLSDTGKSVVKVDSNDRRPDVKDRNGPLTTSNEKNPSTIKTPDTSTSQTPQHNLNSSERTEDGILAANSGGSFNKFEKVELELPTLGKLNELPLQTAQDALKIQLTRLNGVRVEMTVRDMNRALERVQKSLSTKQIKLLIDPMTLTRLRKSTLRTDVGIFVENVTAETIIGLLRECDTAGAFEGTYIVKDLARWDRTELSALLGIDPLSVKPGAPRKKAAVDIRKPLPEQTQVEVVAALEGKGVPRPITESEHLGYAAQLPATRTRPAELKSFLAARKAIESGKLQVFLVLRSLGN